MHVYQVKLYFFLTVIMYLWAPGNSEINYLFSRESQCFPRRSQRRCIIVLTDLPSAIKKMLDKISFYKHFQISFHIIGVKV